jgi:hypothetical protein
MPSANCIARLVQAAGRSLSQDEIDGIFSRVHKAALDIKNGKTPTIDTGMGAQADNIVTLAAKKAAEDLMREAAVRERQAHLQVLSMGRNLDAYQRLTAAGVKPFDALDLMIFRNFKGKTSIESMEQRVMGVQSDLLRRVMPTWEALGRDWFGMFQDEGKLVTLVRELRGENTGDAIAKKGAKAFHEAAETARQLFNQAGGDVGRLDDWGMPQHHSQARVAGVKQAEWVDAILPLLDRNKYVDIAGQPMTDADMRGMLGKAYDTISTGGIANQVPGQFKGTGKLANRHSESRVIHFKDAESTIAYWRDFGERSPLEILYGHLDTMARDIAIAEYFGPNDKTTFQTLRDTALQDAVLADRKNAGKYQERARTLDRYYDYATGRTQPSANLHISNIADTLGHLNTAGKLGGAALASLFGDRAMYQAVAMLNHLPMLKDWGQQISLLNPTNAADRRALQQQGLMLESIRGGLTRFHDGFGHASSAAQFTGKLANAVMRISGMSAINAIPKGAFGAGLFHAIGNEIAAGKTFAQLADSDVRVLRNWGITEADWHVWQLAKLEDIGGYGPSITPEAIGRVTDAELQQAGIIPQAAQAGDGARARHDAVVKLLGAVNTEADFAIISPGWKERAQFYSNLQRGTVPGEIGRAVLQFKSFPWTQVRRMFDLMDNAEGPVTKASMSAAMLVALTAGGAMTIQVREMLSGKDPRNMNDKKFWGAAFMQGGALGIYGDFLYGATNTRYGSGILETVSGPTIGPLLEMGLVQPAQAIKAQWEGRESNLVGQTLQDLKGFIPGGNLWYTKAAIDHLFMQQIMEQLSPGYLSSIRQRTQKDYQQDWWWAPGDLTPDRGPRLEAAVQ